MPPSGAALGTPATLAALRRTRAGAFALADAHPLPDIQAAKDAGRLEAALPLLMEPEPAVIVSPPGTPYSRLPLVVDVID